MTISGGGFDSDDSISHAGYICAAGNTYAAQWWVAPDGTLTNIIYIGQDGVTADPRIDFGTWLWGSCAPVARHTFRAVMPLPAGNTIVTHNINLAGPAAVEVRDNVTGEEIPVRVVAENANSVTLAVAVAEAAARITITAVEY